MSIITTEFRKRKRADFHITQKLEVLRYKDIHLKASRQAKADNLIDSSLGM